MRTNCELTTARYLQATQYFTWKNICMGTNEFWRDTLVSTHTDTKRLHSFRRYDGTTETALLWCCNLQHHFYWTFFPCWHLFSPVASSPIYLPVYLKVNKILQILGRCHPNIMHRGTRLCSQGQHFVFQSVVVQKNVIAAAAVGVDSLQGVKPLTATN